MNREESIKLLALIKVAYPTAYKDMDNASKQATVNMWQTTFPDVPYLIMEMAFNRYRMASKFPPTVAEMCEELEHLHWQAVEESLRCVAFGRNGDTEKYEWIMENTEAYRNGSYLDAPIYAGVNKLTGGTIAGALESGKDGGFYGDAG